MTGPSSSSATRAGQTDFNPLATRGLHTPRTTDELSPFSDVRPNPHRRLDPLPATLIRAVKQRLNPPRPRPTAIRPHGRQRPVEDLLHPPSCRATQQSPLFPLLLRSIRPLRREGPAVERHRFVVEGAWLLAFCGIFSFLALAFARSAAPTFDENTHLGAGYAYWQWQDFRLNPEHPPLLKRWAAVPLVVSGEVWPPSVAAQESDFAASPYFDSGRLLRILWATALKYPNAQAGVVHQLFYGITDEVQRRFGVENPLLVPLPDRWPRGLHGDLGRLRIPVFGRPRSGSGGDGRGSGGRVGREHAFPSLSGAGPLSA